SFGVLPSFMLFFLLNAHVSFGVALIAFLMAVFSALRLAKFNIDTNQSDSFIGVPTPAAALMITGIPLLPASLFHVVNTPIALILILLVTCFLLVAPFRLLALKFKNFSWTDNKVRFTFLLASVLLLALFRQSAISLIILFYIVVSLVSQASM